MSNSDMTSNDFKELGDSFQQIQKLYETEEDVKLEPSTKQRITELLNKFKGSEKVLKEFNNAFDEDDDDDDIPVESSESFRFDLTVLFNAWHEFRVVASLTYTQRPQAVAGNPEETQPLNSSSQPNDSTSSTAPQN